MSDAPQTPTVSASPSAGPAPSPVTTPPHQPGVFSKMAVKRVIENTDGKLEVHIHSDGQHILAAHYTIDEDKIAYEHWSDACQLWMQKGRPSMAGPPKPRPDRDKLKTVATAQAKATADGIQAKTDAHMQERQSRAAGRTKAAAAHASAVANAAAASGDALVARRATAHDERLKASEAHENAVAQAATASGLAARPAPSVPPPDPADITKS